MNGVRTVDPVTPGQGSPWLPIGNLPFVEW